MPAYDSWMLQKTRNWDIKGGFGVNLGAIAKGGVKVWYFKNMDLGKSYPFLYLEGGAGATFGAKFDNIFDLLSKWSGRGADASGGNPLSIPGLDKTSIKQPFSFFDIMGAAGGTFSAGVAAIAAVEVKVFRVTNGHGVLIEVDAPAVEAKIGVEINVMSLTAGTFAAFHMDFWKANSKAHEEERFRDFQRMIKTPASQQWVRGNKI